MTASLEAKVTDRASVLWSHSQVKQTSFTLHFFQVAVSQRIKSIFD